MGTLIDKRERDSEENNVQPLSRRNFVQFFLGVLGTSLVAKSILDFFLPQTHNATVVKNGRDQVAVGGEKPKDEGVLPASEVDGVRRLLAEVDTGDGKIVLSEIPEKQLWEFKIDAGVLGSIPWQDASNPDNQVRRLVITEKHNEIWPETPTRLGSYFAFSMVTLSTSDLRRIYGAQNDEKMRKKGAGEVTFFVTSDLKPNKSYINLITAESLVPGVLPPRQEPLLNGKKPARSTVNIWLSELERLSHYTAEEEGGRDPVAAKNESKSKPATIHHELTVPFAAFNIFNKR